LNPDRLTGWNRWLTLRVQSYDAVDAAERWPSDGGHSSGDSKQGTFLDACFSRKPNARAGWHESAWLAVCRRRDAF
jgi:hypothetical protein